MVEDWVGGVLLASRALRDRERKRRGEEEEQLWEAEELLNIRSAGGGCQVALSKSGAGAGARSAVTGAGAGSASSTASDTVRRTGLG